MATPAPSDKVKDKEYANWLKVTLALYYMKSGLHTFVQSEIDCLHQSLVQKIYGLPTVLLPPCSMCDASHVIRNKYSGVWTFPKQCGSYCDVWLFELLKLHNNPKSGKIYWDNSHVPSWPFKPWECAKVYMPRGQLPSTVGPADCDAQALLTLLSSCTCFHHKLSPQGQNLSHAISTIRNQVMHHAEMKVSDADRTSFIQQIIQLLEDPAHLKSLEDCKAAVSNIHKIDNVSVDVFFNVNQEMTALSSVVKELRLELGMLENKIMDNVDSLKEEYRQLREQLTNRLEDVEKKLELHGESTTKGCEGVEKKLELQGERVQENVLQLHKLKVNVELHQKRLGAVENNAELHVQRFGAIEEMIEIHEERLGALEQNVEIHEERIGAFEQNVEIHEERLVAVEQNVVKLQEEIGHMTKGNNSCMQEKLHRSVLNRCLPVLLRDLDFKTVSIYIQQKEIFDDVTMRDILEHGAPLDKIMGLIQQIQQRNQDAYETFKECLVLAKQGDLKDMLEEEEERVAIDKDIASSVPDYLDLAAEHGKLLGRGAFGEVYKWYDSKFRTMMAVKKVPHYGSTIERGIAESLVNEIKILKSLNHGRIIRYYGCSEEETWIQIFMEYMPNGSVKDFMFKYHTPLEEEFYVKVTRHILEGIAYLHENKILHRDIKASNVLLDSEMNAKLGDFGISKELHTLTHSITHCETYVGTPYWMSPERVRGEKYRRSADIWSIGCTVIEMITMKPPWYEFETNAAIFQIGQGVYPKYQLPSTVSPHIADLLSQTFQQEASKRPTALELLNHPFLT